MPAPVPQAKGAAEPSAHGRGYQLRNLSGRKLLRQIKAKEFNGRRQSALLASSNVREMRHPLCSQTLSSALELPTLQLPTLQHICCEGRWVRYRPVRAGAWRGGEGGPPPPDQPLCTNAPRALSEPLARPSLLLPMSPHPGSLDSSDARGTAWARSTPSLFPAKCSDVLICQ